MSKKSLAIQIQLANINKNAWAQTEPAKIQTLSNTDLQYLLKRDNDVHLGFDPDVLDIDPATEAPDPITPMAPIVYPAGIPNPPGMNRSQAAKRQYLDDQFPDLLNEVPAVVTAAVFNVFWVRKLPWIMNQINALNQQAHDDTTRQATADYNIAKALEEEANNVKLAHYKARLQNLNLGIYSATQLPHESDGEYQARMSAMKDALPNQQQVIDQEKQNQRALFRKNMTSITNDGVVIEQVLNNPMITDNSILKINSAWGRIMTELKTQYKKIDVPTLIDFFDTYLNKLDQTGGVQGVITADIPEVGIVQPGDVFYTFDENGQQVTVGMKANRKGQNKPYDFEANQFISGQRNGIQTFFKKLPLYKRFFGKNDATFEKAFNLVSDQDLRPYDVGNGDHVINDPQDFFRINGLHGINGTGIKKKKKPTIKYGNGITIDTDAPAYVNFGKFIINTQKLHENILRVLYGKSGININTIKSTHISEDFKDLLMEIIEKNKFNERVFNRLVSSEKQLFGKLIKMAGLKSVLGIKSLSDPDNDEKLTRWAIVQGEIDAGNDSEKLKKEAKSLIYHFIKSGQITNAQANPILLSLSI